MGHSKSLLKLLISIFIIISFLITCDIYLNQSFQRSQTRKLLHKSGIYDVHRKYSPKISTQANIFLNKLQKSTSNYVENLSHYTGRIMVYLHKQLRPVIDWINDTIPPLLEKIDSELFPKLTNLTKNLFANIATHIETVNRFFVELFMLISEWIQQNILVGSLAPEKIMQAAVDFVDVVQMNCVHLASWVGDRYRQVFA